MTDARTPPDDGVAAFVAHLRKLKDRDDRGALAALRRSLQDPNGMAAVAFPYVVPFLPPKEDLYRDRAFFLVGALFALHPETGGNGTSLGHAFRKINDDQQGPAARDRDNESLRRRFVALLDADAEDLPEHLRNAVSLARARQVALDWERLLRDVLAWRSESRHIQRRLAREFWTERQSPLAPEGEISQ